MGFYECLLILVKISKVSLLCSDEASPEKMRGAVEIKEEGIWGQSLSENTCNHTLKCLGKRPSLI